MIKRFSFVDRTAGVGPETFAGEWVQAVADLTAAAPDEVRPVRVAACTTRAEVAGPDPRHDALAIEWFDAAADVDRFVAWRGSPEGRARAERSSRLVGGEACVVVADEVVLRGEDWLVRRWDDGGPRLKHMALARRADGLRATDFSERWRNHAGVASSTVIPEDVRGQAYVQNHPLARTGGDWAYDAINEVYFDDPESLGRRIRWFHDNRVGVQSDGLTGASWFLAVRETIVFPSA